MRSTKEYTTGKHLMPVLAIPLVQIARQQQSRVKQHELERGGFRGSRTRSLTTSTSQPAVDHKQIIVHTSARSLAQQRPRQSGLALVSQMDDPYGRLFGYDFLPQTMLIRFDWLDHTSTNYRTRPNRICINMSCDLPPLMAMALRLTAAVIGPKFSPTKATSLQQSNRKR